MKSVGLSADFGISFGGTSALALRKCATWAPHRADITCACHNGKFFFVSFLVTRQSIERAAPGAEEAMNEVVKEPSSDYHVKMVVT